MSGLDVSRLSPGDTAAALRSYPRRYTALLTTFDSDEKPDDLVHRAGSDGLSAVDHVDHVARTFALLGKTVQDVLQRDDVALPPGAFDDAAREWQVGGGQQSLQGALDFLAVEADALADAVDRVPAEQWARRATLAGDGREVTALDVVREAVRTGAEHLQTAERTLAAARGS